VSQADPSAARYAPAWEDAVLDRLAALVKQYPQAAQSVIPAIYELAADPYPTGSTRHGGSGTYRRLLLLGCFRARYAASDGPPRMRVIPGRPSRSAPLSRAPTTTP
jgi:hypothetical protein